MGGECDTHGSVKENLMREQNPENTAQQQQNGMTCLMWRGGERERERETISWGHGDKKKKQKQKTQGLIRKKVKESKVTSTTDRKHLLREIRHTE